MAAAYVHVDPPGFWTESDDDGSCDEDHSDNSGPQHPLKTDSTNSTVHCERVGRPERQRSIREGVRGADSRQLAQTRCLPVEQELLRRRALKEGALKEGDSARDPSGSGDARFAAIDPSLMAALCNGLDAEGGVVTRKGQPAAAPPPRALQIELDLAPLPAPACWGPRLSSHRALTGSTVRLRCSDLAHLLQATVRGHLWVPQSIVVTETSPM
jgi:hypothetical protein